MELDLFAHNDIEEAAKFFKIPLAMYRQDDVYIMQEDRCVFVGMAKVAERWIKENDGKLCKSIFPLSVL